MAVCDVKETADLARGPRGDSRSGLGSSRQEADFAREFRPVGPQRGTRVNGRGSMIFAEVRSSRFGIMLYGSRPVGWRPMPTAAMRPVELSPVFSFWQSLHSSAFDAV